MPKRDTSIEDLAESIKDMGNMVVKEIRSSETRLGARMDGLDGRMDGLDGRMNKLENRVEQGFLEINGKLETIENDVKALYVMLASVQKDVKALRAQDKKLDQRIYNLEQFAEALSQKTGIPFKT